ncbi:MAG: glycosyltransferase [Saprospiraceae bacterium]|nr:glycosyltransferase [Saprospiraceae bacterium]
MHFSFISLVTILHTQDDFDKLESSLPELHRTLQFNFKDFEIIIVNNTSDQSITDTIDQFEPDIKKEIYLIHLSKITDPNNAILAGLDQANGDYIVFLESQFYNAPSLISDLYGKSQENNDIVYLRSTKSPKGIIRKIALKLFIKIMRRYSTLTMDAQAFDSRIISRRAINSVLRLRENLRYMKAIYSLVGYKSSYIPVDNRFDTSASFSGEIKMYTNAITSFTGFLQVVLRWIFLLSMILFLGTTANAVMVKLLGYDIIGNPQKEVTGWAFTVILISLTFSILCMILYIMSIYLENIYREIKQRPLYIVESVKRF